MNALILNAQGDILFVADVPEGVTRIKVAVAVTLGGAPVNVRSFRVSRSKANWKRAERMDLDPLRKIEHRGTPFYIQ